VFLYANVHKITAMARINIVLDNELDDKFRTEVGKRYGARRGAIQKAIEEAIGLWLKTK
jgi:hypothetical protein